MTNAERIRSMNDEELAGFLVNDIWNWPWCDENAPTDEEKNCTNWGKDRYDCCEKCCKVWLQKEYDENTDIILDIGLSDESISELIPCPHCGKKPKKFLWSNGSLVLICDCGQRGTHVGYAEDEKDLKRIFEKLKSLWNGEKECHDV